jgi:hypothetical protein
MTVGVSAASTAICRVILIHRLGLEIRSAVRGVIQSITLLTAAEYAAHEYCRRRSDIS